MKFKHNTYLMILTVISACTPNTGTSEVSHIISESDTNVTKSEKHSSSDKPVKSFDSTIFIGSWKILEADVSALTYPYVGHMPELFQISDLSQFRSAIVDARFENSGYSFFVNTLDVDSLILYLHPAICKCEGLEVRYQKQ